MRLFWTHLDQKNELKKIASFGQKHGLAPLEKFNFFTIWNSRKLGLTMALGVTHGLAKYFTNFLSSFFKPNTF